MLGTLLGPVDDRAVVGGADGWLYGPAGLARVRLLVQERSDVLGVEASPERVTQKVGDGRALVQEGTGVPLRLGEVEGAPEGSQGLVCPLAETVAADT